MNEPEKHTKSNASKKDINPWFWIPSLYFAEGLPYVVVMTVSVIMYKRLGISNTDIALYTSWLYLPWVIKPLWSPVVDIFKTKRLWIVVMQLVIGAGLGGVALTIPASNYFKFTLGFFWLLAFGSATQDIAIDGFYMLSLSKHKQTWFVGVRSTFYRFAMISGQGLLIILAGYIESISGLPTANFNVTSNPSIRNFELTHPESIDVTPIDGNLRFILNPSVLEISTNAPPDNFVDSTIVFAKEWNVKNGFYSGKSGIQTQDNISDESTWWGKLAVAKLESFLKTHFGPETKTLTKDNLVGNVGVLYIHLSNKPQSSKKLVVNFGREVNDKSIKVAEGEHWVVERSDLRTDLE